MVYENYKFDECLSIADVPKIVKICKNFCTIDRVIVGNTETGADAYHRTFTNVDLFINQGLPDDEYIDYVSFNLQRAGGDCMVSIDYGNDFIDFRHFRNQDLGLDEFVEYLEKEIRKE